MILVEFLAFVSSEANIIDQLSEISAWCETSILSTFDGAKSDGLGLGGGGGGGPLLESFQKIGLFPPLPPFPRLKTAPSPHYF